MFASYILGVQGNFRGNSLVEELRVFGISPTIVWGPKVGVDDALIKENTNQDFANFSINREIKPQEVACCLGHFRMYEKFYESEQDWGLFLEDDALMLANPSDFIENLTKTNEPLHIFIHDGPGTNLAYRQKSLFSKQELVRYLDPQYGAYGYLLNRSAVIAILNSSAKRLINTPDWPYFWPKNMKFLVSNQVYFSHPNDSSMSIIGERVNREATLRSQFPHLLNLLRGLKFTDDALHLYHKEIYLKAIRISLQLRKRLFK